MLNENILETQVIEQKNLVRVWYTFFTVVHHIKLIIPIVNDIEIKYYFATSCQWFVIDVNPVDDIVPRKLTT